MEKQATLTAVSSTAKIHITGTPRKLDGPVILFSGDVAHLSIAVCANFTYYDGSLDLSGDVARNIKVQYIGLVPAPYDMPPVGDGVYSGDDYYELRPEKIYPDVLEDVDIKRIHSAPNFNQGFFLTITDSDRIPVGDSEVKVTFCVNNEKFAETSFTIRKLAVSLPKQKCISGAWMHYDSIAAQHNVRLFGKPFYKVFASYLDAAAYSGQNMILVPIFTPALDTDIGHERRTAQLLEICEDEDGNFTFDFSAMHEFIEFVKSHGMEYLEMPPLFTQWGALNTPKIMVCGTDGRLRRRFGWETEALSDDYRRFLSALLPALIKELRDIGMEENTFFHISDEPKAKNLEHYKACKAFVMPLLGDKCRTLDACGVDFAGNSPREYAVAVVYRLHEFIDAGIRPLCTYFCCSPTGKYFPNRFLAMPLPRLLSLGVSLWRHDIDLFLHWGFNFFNSFNSRRETSPYNNTTCDMTYCAGDGFIVYPDNGRKACNRSIRLVATREMFRVAKMLYLLEEKIGREAVTAFLETEGFISLTEYPREDGAFDRFLLRLADALEKSNT
ncbi:MAG: DUF4091 domain-containing protein [Ruminococcaceae bacterium]|nr:DUF4091 domain-containing protein [Oscillospiraceae bacterium]